MKRLREKAYAKGATFRTYDEPLRPGQLPVATNDMSWKISGRCQSPVTVLVKSRPDGRGPHRRTEFMEIEAKCRKCDQCLRDRAAHWRLRAITEYRAAPRSWLWTMTLSPEHHHMCLSRARRHIDAQGIDFDCLQPVDQFEMRLRESARLVSLAFKRLRKGGTRSPPASFRYLLVAEAHQSGLPHFHAVIHEIGDPIRWRDIDRAWNAGHMKANLIRDERQAVYACKYLTKSAMARVRASLGYGNPRPLAIGSGSESDKATVK